MPKISSSITQQRQQQQQQRAQREWQTLGPLAASADEAASKVASEHSLFDKPATTAAGEQSLFRHRFLVSSDLCVRLPIEASTLMRAFVVQSHLAGVIHLQCEAFRPIGNMRWSPDAERMLSLPSAGGSSIVSETLAFELLARAFGASLERTECELDYAFGSQMTDFAIKLYGGYPLGVSVTRAYKWRGGRRWGLQEPSPRGMPRGSGLDPYEARRLLAKKLAGINVSSRNVRNYRWRKQILFTWCFTHRDAMLLEQIYQELPASLRANTVLLITRCDGVEWIN